jgi:hypothetical protein
VPTSSGQGHPIRIVRLTVRTEFDSYVRSYAEARHTLAGLYGLVVLLSLYLLEHRLGQDYPPSITHPEFYYGFVGVSTAC